MRFIKDLKKDVNEFLDGFKTMHKDLSTKEKRVKQIPNLVTLSRVLLGALIPPFALSGNLIGAGILTVGAIFTDAIDGFVARKLNAVSEFGKNLDPVCDKIFAGVLIAPLVVMSPVISTLKLTLTLILELGIASINLQSKVKGNIPRTTILGKFKTAILSMLMASLYLSFSVPSISKIIPAIYLLTTITQCATMIDYYRIDKNKDIIKEENKLKQEKIMKQINNKGTLNINNTLTSYFIKRNSFAKKKTLKPTENDIESYKLTLEDYINLRKQLIRMHSEPVTEKDKIKTYQI